MVLLQGGSRGQALYAASEGGSLGAETSLPHSSVSIPSSASAATRDSTLESQAESPGGDQSLQVAEKLGTEDAAAPASNRSATHSASEVLRSHSESSNFPGQGQEPPLKLFSYGL